MKEFIVGGLVAGLVSGSIVAGAIVMTSGGSSGPMEVYGSVAIENNRLEGGMDIPIVVQQYEPYGSNANAPDGSMDRPFYVSPTGAVYVYSCENITSPLITACRRP